MLMLADMDGKLMTTLHKLALTLAVSVAVTACNGSQQQTASTSGPSADNTIPAAYQQQYRPQFHFSPQQNWMNDPNGLVYHNGEYHLFYQYNPEGNRWGHMSWGHAVSKDLVHWEELDVAIPESDEYMIFSGSAVVDHHNTSGFGSIENPPLVAIYTGHKQEPAKGQNQHLAYSTDNGRTWTKYSGNPVLDENLQDFRDPKVFWHEETQQWIMVLALSTEYKVAFYGSPNLKDWKLLSHFESPASELGIWECPDLFQLPVDGDPNRQKWVLEVDLGAGEEGSVAGGSGGLYFVGEFDGKQFIPDADLSEDATVAPHQWVDYGKDFYAAVSWSDIPKEDGRRLWIGWMNNWQYAQELPTHPWRSSQSIVRSLSLKSKDGKVLLAQTPVKELEVLREEPVTADNIHLRNRTQSLDEQGIEGKALELKVTFDTGDAKKLGLNLRVGNGEKTVVGYDVTEQKLFVDRTQSGRVEFHEQFPGVHAAPLVTEDGKLDLHIFIDWSSIEVFAADGTVVISDKIFPQDSSQGLEVFAEGGSATLESLTAWPLKSAW